MHHVILQQELPGGSSRIDVRRLLQCHPFPCCNDLQKKKRKKEKRRIKASIVQHTAIKRRQLSKVNKLTVPDGQMVRY